MTNVDYLHCLNIRKTLNNPQWVVKKQNLARVISHGPPDPHVKKIKINPYLPTLFLGSCGTKVLVLGLTSFPHWYPESQKILRHAQSPRQRASPSSLVYSIVAYSVARKAFTCRSPIPAFNRAEKKIEKIIIIQIQFPYGKITSYVVLISSQRRTLDFQINIPT